MNVVYVIGARESTERITLSNLAHFDREVWDCEVFTTSAFATKSRDRCRVNVARRGSLFHILHGIPRRAYNNYAILLDDVMLEEPFNMARFMNLSRESHVFSPRVQGSTFPHMRMPSGCTPFIEIFFTVYTAAAWDCLSTIVNMAVSLNLTSGWGAELCFPSACRVYNRQRVVDSYNAVHFRNRPRSGHARARLEVQRLSEAVAKRVGRRCLAGSKYLNPMALGHDC